MKKDKTSVALGIGVILAVIVTFILYVLGAGSLDISEYAMMGIVIAILAGAIIIVAMNYKNMRLGLPVKDERYHSINHRAGYYAFIAAIWISLGTAFMGNYINLPWRYNSYIILLGTGLVFVVSYLILNRKGE